MKRSDVNQLIRESRPVKPKVLYGKGLEQEQNSLILKSGESMVIKWN